MEDQIPMIFIGQEVYLKGQNEDNSEKEKQLSENSPPIYIRIWFNLDSDCWEHFIKVFLAVEIKLIHAEIEIDPTICVARMRNEILQTWHKDKFQRQDFQLWQNPYFDTLWWNTIIASALFVSDSNCRVKRWGYCNRKHIAPITNPIISIKPNWF